MQRLTPERIREWLHAVMDERGWKAAEWARRAKVAPTTVTRALREDTQGFQMSAATLDKLAVAAGVSPLGAQDIPRSGYVPIVGMVGADPEGRVLFANGDNPGDLAPIPPGGSRKARALEVRGHSMPFFAEDGALVYFEDQHTQPTRDMLGRVVVVETAGGEVLVKRLLRGSTADVYDLESINGPTRRDEQLNWAAFVTAVIPPPKSQELILRGAARVA